MAVLPFRCVRESTQHTIQQCLNPYRLHCIDFTKLTDVIKKQFTLAYVAVRSLCLQGSLDVCFICCMFVCACVCGAAGAVSAVSEVAQRIQDNARSHENHLQLQRVQKLLKGRKTRLLAPG